MLSVCPDIKPPPAQIHAMTSGHDDASDSSDNESVIVLTQIDEAILAQASSTCPFCRPIDSDLLLLDSQSTVHLFSHPEHVTNIHQAEHPIRVHCNKGTLNTTEEANFGSTPVYLDSRGIANVLLLHKLGQKFSVTYDSNDTIVAGSSRFGRTTATLSSLRPTVGSMRSTCMTTLTLHFSSSTTVSPIRTAPQWRRSVKILKDFTKRQIKQAIKARRLMSMIGLPSEREYQGLVHLNLLKDCPITNADIIHTNKIVGPDLAKFKG
jgi:hypothetical protein